MMIIALATRSSAAGSAQSTTCLRSSKSYRKRLELSVRVLRVVRVSLRPSSCPEVDIGPLESRS